MAALARFPFTFVGKARLGSIYRPYAEVFCYAKVRSKWQPVEMVIDSGADYTLFPKRYAAIFGVDLSRDCWPETTLGVGGSETVYQFKALPVRIGSWQKDIPVGFLERDDVPPLLGRLGCLEKVRLVLADRKASLED